jgi:hypothetical protein
MNSYWGVLLTILHMITRIEKTGEDEALTARVGVLALTAPTWNSTDQKLDLCYGSQKGMTTHHKDQS